MEIKTEGFKSLIKKLEYLGGNADKIVQDCLFQGATRIQREARERVPVDTGDLKRSITVAKIEDGYSVGTNKKYGVYVEHGTGTKGDQRLPHTARKFWRYRDSQRNWHTCRGMKPRPFLHPAYNKGVPYTRKLIKAALGEAVKKKMHGG